MEWRNPFGVRRHKVPTWAALCNARADGSNPPYLAQSKHSILVMVRAPESEADGKVYALLQSNGWHDPAIQRRKMLDEPFQSDDPIMAACYKGAVHKDGGIIVYSDPIEDA